MRRTKEDAEQTKEAILNGAIGLFSSKGVEATSLDEIARAANVTRGAIYWHFNNKIEIFDALHARLYEPLASMIMTDLENDHPEPIEQLKDLCIQCLLDLEDDEIKKQALSLFLFQCTYSGDLVVYREKHRDAKSKSLKLFEKYFDRAKQKGTIPNTADPELLTLSVHCYMKGVLFEYLTNPKGFDIRKKGVALLELYFSYLLK